MAKWLLEKGTDILLTNQDQSRKGPSFVLGDAVAETLLTLETDSLKALAAVQKDICISESNETK